ncbi:MAG: energy transducer TonB [Myxococcota bacterium]
MTRLVPPLVLSLLVHVGVLYGASAVERPPPRKKPKPIEVAIVQKKDPPKLELPPEPKPSEEPKPKPKPSEAPKKATPAPPKAEAAPPPPPSAAPKPVAFSLEMESTVSAGDGPVVRTGGGNLFADPKKEGDPAPQVTSRPAPPPSGSGVDPKAMGEGSTPPVLLLSDADRRPPYTKEALAREVEGRIDIEIVVGEDGRVQKATLRRGLGYGLDEAALEFVRTRYRFRPGTHNGKPVAQIIVIPITFEIND